MVDHDISESFSKMNVRDSLELSGSISPQPESDEDIDEFVVLKLPDLVRKSSVAKEQKKMIVNSRKSCFNLKHQREILKSVPPSPNPTASHYTPPSELIAQLLTAQGHSSFFPARFPMFREASLIPPPPHSTKQYNSKEVEKLRMKLLHGRPSQEVFIQETLADSFSTTPNKIKPITGPGNTCSVVFPLRNKRKSWRRTSRIV